MNEIAHMIERHYHHGHAAQQVDGIYTQHSRGIRFSSRFDQIPPFSVVNHKNETKSLVVFFVKAVVFSWFFSSGSLLVSFRHAVIGLVAELSHRTKTRCQEFDIRYRNVRALAGTGRCDPKRASFAATSSGLDHAAKNHDVLVRGVRMGRDNSAARESGAMNRPVFNRLRQRQQCHTRQKIDRDPPGRITVDKGLRFGHCISFAMKNSLRLARLEAISARLRRHSPDVTGINHADLAVCCRLGKHIPLIDPNQINRNSASFMKREGRRMVHATSRVSSLRSLAPRQSMNDCLKPWPGCITWHSSY
jgi:hypothetical protein